MVGSDFPSELCTETFVSELTLSMVKGALK